MWKYPKKYCVIVVGGGHAGCEASYISAKRNAQTLLITTNLDTIGKMSCNPSIGGIAKGHIAREIDALGGLMGKAIDNTSIHFRMLNTSKGPAVRAPRAQADKSLYSIKMKNYLENTLNLDIHQDEVIKIICKNQQVTGVLTKNNVLYEATSVILTPGTFLNGKIHIGEVNFSAGRMAENASSSLSNCLKELNLDLTRLKTGTPPRIHADFINYEFTEEQKSEKNINFSFWEKPFSSLEQKSCFITYTTDKTKEIIQKNYKLSALFSGAIKGIGPRYCPSIEDKIFRFPTKERHQLFLEPEGINTKEIYVNGLSSSLPYEIQMKILKSIPSLKNAKILRPAYAIEYDCITSGQLYASLETKKIKNLYLAGQINGTSGYEEAAAQGLIAGINASKKTEDLPFVLNRSESYIGVLINDITTKILNEPYRMFSSRAEYRLLLRHDNAHLRLYKHAYNLKLITKKQHDSVDSKQVIINEEIQRLKKTYKNFDNKSLSVSQLLSRPEISYTKLNMLFPDAVKNHGNEINEQIEINIKFEGYIKHQAKEVNKLQNLEKKRIPSGFSYKDVKGLKREAQEKLIKFSPDNLGVASKIAGVSPADISVLMIEIEKKLCKHC